MEPLPLPSPFLRLAQDKKERELSCEVNPKSWTLNQPLIIQLSIVVSSVLYRAHSF